eukprot:6084469-Pleurochrysis_carterae.AAC.4
MKVSHQTLLHASKPWRRCQAALQASQLLRYTDAVRALGARVSPLPQSKPGYLAICAKEARHALFIIAQ